MHTYVCTYMYTYIVHEKRPQSLHVCMCLCGCARARRDLRTGGYDVHQLAVLERVFFAEGFSDGENLHIRTRRPCTLDPHPKPIHLPAPSTIAVLGEGYGWLVRAIPCRTVQAQKLRGSAGTRPAVPKHIESLNRSTHTS